MEYSEGGGTQFGIQASTNFEQMLVGLKIQMKDFAITPKVGFFVESFKTDNVDALFGFEFGSSFDWYPSKWREGRLRPYIGDSVLFSIGKQDETGFWFVDDIHVGAEYWLSDSFSFGGNVGVQFGFGESRYTPNTVGVVINEANFSFGLGGILHLTYYF